MKSYNEILSDVTKTATKIPQSDYLDTGKYRIFDQGTEYSVGFSNDEQGVVSDYPYIIFGDHTRVVKYVNEPCFIGADGVKLLKVINKDFNPRFVYYNILAKPIENQGYARHFKFLKEIQFTEKTLSVQTNIVTELDTIQSAIDNKKQQLSLLDEAVKSRFIEMFGDPVQNPMGWEVRKLKETTDIITGNTPSRKDKENYGAFIEWIKTDNITDKTYVTTAAEYLSEKGEMLGRTVEAGSILMACIAGSLRSIGRVALTDRKVAFNQQINAIVPKKYNSLFLYVLFQNTQSYAQSTVNMALKGILSKGKLEELEYIIPPIELQNDFAAFVQQIDKSKFAVQKSLEKAETLYKSLMQEYFA